MMSSMNCTPRVQCKSNEHEARFREAVRALPEDVQERPDWLAILYVLTFSHTLWDRTRLYLHPDTDVINLVDTYPDPQSQLIQVAEELHMVVTESVAARVGDLLDLDDERFDLVLGALQIRRYGTRVLSWLRL